MLAEKGKCGIKTLFEHTVEFQLGCLERMPLEWLLNKDCQLLQYRVTPIPKCTSTRCG